MQTTTRTPNRKYQFQIVCSSKPPFMEKKEFINFVKQILNEENVSTSNYRLYVKEYHIFISLANSDDMIRILKNKKYVDVNGFLIHFVKHYKQSTQKTLYIIGIPKDTSAQELDEILSESYKIHEVTKLIPSDEDPNYLFAKVKFDSIEDAKRCKETLFEIKGNHVNVYDYETIKSTSSSDSSNSQPEFDNQVNRINQQKSFIIPDVSLMIKGITSEILKH